MNTFLQGCCYIPPDDDNVPTSNSEYSAYSTTSSTTTDMCNPINTYQYSNYLQLKHTIKEDTSKLIDVSNCQTNLDDAKTSGKSSMRCSFKNMDADCYTKISNSSEENKRNYKYTVIPTVSKHSSVQSSSYTSSYGPTISSRPPNSSQNQLLDRLSSCLWKCSIGCHQIPTLNT